MREIQNRKWKIAIWRAKMSVFWSQMEMNQEFSEIDLPPPALQTMCHNVWTVSAILLLIYWSISLRLSCEAPRTSGWVTLPPQSVGQSVGQSVHMTAPGWGGQRTDDSAVIAAATHQFVPPLDLLLHILDGESPDVVAVWVGRDEGGGEKLQSKWCV